jgi:hypothetical protein
MVVMVIVVVMVMIMVMVLVVVVVVMMVTVGDICHGGDGGDGNSDCCYRQRSVSE